MNTSPAIQAIQDGQALGEFHRSIEKTEIQKLEERVKILEDIVILHRKTIEVEGRLPNIPDIINAVAFWYDRHPDSLKRGSRHNHECLPRFIVMYLSRELTELSFEVIAEQMGGYDHGSIIHGVKKCKEIMETDSDYAFNCRQIEVALRAKWSIMKGIIG